MKVICAPDSFKESLHAIEAAKVMAAGVREVLPDADIDRCPIGDGGEGTLASLLESVNGRRIGTNVADVFGRSIKVDFGVLDIDDDRVAFIESASVIGLAMTSRRDRDVMRSSSSGIGEMILHAVDEKPAKIIVGLGGSATNDGGCGMAQSLGVKFYDAANRLIEKPITGSMLASIGRIDMSERADRLLDVPVTIASDVTNVLSGPLGAAAVFAAQKGANNEQIKDLDKGLIHLAELIRRDLDIDVEHLPGGGAAGGLGAGLIAFAGASVVSGIDTVLAAVQFENRVKHADLCLTGEGCLDAQSLAGKACIGVAKIAASYNVPVVALVGSAGPGAERAMDAGITEVVTIGAGLSKNESMQRTASLLSAAAARIGRKYG